MFLLFQGVQPHNPANAPNVSLTDGSSRIVTNVSSQRFATSATSSGTTITFGRAPPNVTISNCIPPPLTKIATEGSSSHVTTTTNVTVEPPNHLAIHAVSAVQTASSVSVPQPFSSGSVHVPSVSRPSFATSTTGQMPVGAGQTEQWNHSSPSPACSQCSCSPPRDTSTGSVCVRSSKQQLYATVQSRIAFLPIIVQPHSCKGQGSKPSSSRNCPSSSK